MDFSIITPSFNYGRYIGDCLESVASQHGVSIEHLVMDAGSSDNTAQVVRGFPHATFFQEPDEGMSHAINKGFIKAKGTWLMWLNADDFLQPGALAAVMEFASSHPDADAIYGTYQFVDASGKAIRTMKLLPYNRFVSLHYGCYVPSTATFLKRKSTVAEGHLLDKRMRLVMDNEYYVRLSLAGKKLIYFPRVLASFRIHENNLSSVGGVARGGLDAELEFATKRAESEAVRRTYGITISKNIAVTHGFDALLYLIAWLAKGFLKLPTYFSVSAPKEG